MLIKQDFTFKKTANRYQDREGRHLFVRLSWELKRYHHAI